MSINMESDSDSDSSGYVVENYVLPDKIRAPVNDESADILGNFDDKKRSDILNKKTLENGYAQMPAYSTAEQALADSSSDDNEAKDESESDDDAGASKSKNLHITDTQLEALLRGAKSQRRVLYVTNMNFESTKEDLQTHFSQAGQVKTIRVPPNRRGGFAFVEMESMEGFRKALELHNTVLQGRSIKVQISEGGKKKSANKKNILKQKNRKLAEMRKESKCFTKSGKYYDKSLKKEKMKEAMLRKRWRKPKKSQ